MNNNEINYLRKVDCRYLDDQILKKCFRTLVLSYCDKEHPDELNPLSQVSCGSVFRSSNKITCQIKLLNNGRIFLCKYMEDTQEVILEEYQMVNVVKGGIIENGEEISVGLFDGEYLDEVLMERKLKGDNKPINYEIRHLYKSLN